MEYIWGAVLVGCGVFISVYGTLLFRFVLAVTGFAIGFAGALVVTDGEGAALRILVGLVAGGIGAVVLYSLIKIGMYIAGGLLGVVLGAVVASLVNQLDNGVGWSAAILMIAGAGVGGVFGRRLGDWIIVLATAATGAFLIVYGLLVWFDDRLRGDLDDPSSNLNQSVTLVMFLCLAVVSGLAQFNIMDLRRRLRR